MKHYIPFIILFLFFQEHTFANNTDRWVYLTSNSDTKSKFYIDPNSIKQKNESIKEVWIKMEFSKPKMNISYILSKYIFDCSGDQMLIASAHGFNSRGGSMGGAMAQVDQVKDVIPDTIDETIKDTICYID